MIVVHYLLAYGTEERKHRWLPGLTSGVLVGAIAMTEPGTGSVLQIFGGYGYIPSSRSPRCTPPPASSASTAAPTSS